MLRLYNTLSRKKEVFKPVGGQKKVGLYTCGPTVYSYAHIGNLKTYTFEDILKRVLLFNGYQVKHAMNITDVGHLTSDADTGEDKIEQEARKEGKSAWQIADFYTRSFFIDTKKLNILKPDVIARATDYIDENIILIQELERHGFTYRTSDGIYFDTSKLKDYGKLTGMTFQKLNQTLKAGSRIELSPEKKNITDFSLWKFSPDPAAGKAKRQMEWPSPWGMGFPGWHIECAAISLKLLTSAFQGKKFLPKKAKTIDLHCGGIDHISIHHSNEIAQVEAITNKKFVNFWLHGEHLRLPQARMGKSQGNAILLIDLEKKHYHPLALRYLFLNSRYRAPLEFSFQALESSQQSLNNVYGFIYDCLWHIKNQAKIKARAANFAGLKTKWLAAINDDLNTPQALAILWQLMKQYFDSAKNAETKKTAMLNPKTVYQLALEFDQVFGLGLDKIKLIPLSSAMKKLLSQREKARQGKQWQQADQIRQKIEKTGFQVEDTGFGPKIVKQNWF